MLDEFEFDQIDAVYRQCIGDIQGVRQNHMKSLEDIDLSSRFAPVLDTFFALTGFRETNPNAVLHHRASLCGQPCQFCGKPLRTPAASFCAACGASQEQPG
jgi:hypothetical protein